MKTDLNPLMIPARLQHMEARIERDGRHRPHLQRYRQHIRDSGVERDESFQLRKAYGLRIRRFFSITR